MKMYKKIARLTAIGMCVITMSNPVYAASVNGVSRLIQVEKGKVTGLNPDGSFKSGLASHGLVIEPTDGLAEGDIFYLEIKNGRWASEEILNKAMSFTTTNNMETAFGANLITRYKVNEGTEDEKEVIWQFNVTRQSDTRLAVKVVRAPYDATPEQPYSLLKFQLPLAYTPNSGAISIDVRGGASTISNSNVIISKTEFMNEKLLVDTSSVPKVHKSGKVASIMFRETMPGHIAELNVLGGEIRLELQHEDYEFDGTPRAILRDGLYGTSSSVEIELDSNNPKVLIVKLPNTTTTSIGEIELADIKVKTKEERPSTDDIYIKVYGNGVYDESLRVGKGDEYDISVDIEEKENRDIYAGRSETVTVSIEEDIDGSLVSGDTVTFSLEGGNFGTYDGDGDKATQLDKIIELGGDIKITDAKVNRDNEFTSFTASIGKLTDNKIDKIDFNLEVFAPFNYDEEDIELLVRVDGYGRSRFNIFEINDTITVEPKMSTVKKGYRNQSLNSIVIEEQNSSMLRKDGDIIIDLSSLSEDILISEKSNINARVTDGSLKIGTASLNADDKTIKIPVKAASKSKSTIVIDGISLDVKKSALNRVYDVTITGSALGDDIEIDEQYIQVVDGAIIQPDGGENTGNKDIRKGVVEFKVGETLYSYNSVPFKMDAAPFLSNGNIMVPLRYLTEAFGIPASQLSFNNGVVNAYIGNKLLTVRNGSTLATYGNDSRNMGGAMMIKDNRTYIPLGEIGRILDLEVKWNNKYKVATFTKK